MAIKDILFHLGTSRTAQSVGEFAVSLAVLTGAHLTAAGVAIEYPPLVADAGNFGGGWDFSTTELFAMLVEHSRKTTEQAYERFVTSLSPDVRIEFVMIHTLQEIAGDEFGRLARRFDLSVISQGEPEAAEDARQMIVGALFASGRPVFLVPSTYKGPARLDKAIVCWDESMQAARALAESLPLLAQAQIVEVVCVRCADESNESLPGFDITRHLARHGIASVLRELPASSDIGSAILSYTEESAADFIVMGAYGHWRLRELIFGGTTRTILGSTRIPALMAH